MEESVMKINQYHLVKELDSLRGREASLRQELAELSWFDGVGMVPLIATAKVELRAIRSDIARAKGRLAATL